MKNKILLTLFTITIALLLCSNLTSAILETTIDNPLLKEKFTITPEANIYPAIEIKDNWGLPLISSVKAEMVLQSHTSSCSNDCNSIFNIKTYGESSLIDKVSFLKLQADNKTWVDSSIRGYQFYIQDGVNQQLIEDSNYVCNVIGKELNGTDIIKCNKEITGSHIIETPNWKEYNLGEVLPAGEYTIKLIGDKRPDWIYDWKITTQNTIIDSWSVWGAATSNYPQDLLRYFKLDNNTIESVNGLNGSQVSLTTNVSGKLINGINIGSATGWINLSSIPIQKNWTINFWVKKPSTGDISIFGLDTTKMFYIQGGVLKTYDMTDGGTGWNYNIDTELSDNLWHMMTFQSEFNITNNIWRVYLNGTLRSSFNGSATAFIGDTTSLSWGLGKVISRTGNGLSFDEVGIWNRTLNQSEITGLYNSGAGLSYASFYNATGSNVVLNSPANYYNSTTSNVNFNVTANVIGGATLTNITLWLNGLLNSTTILTGTTNTTIFTKTLPEGQTNWTAQGCDSDGACGFATTNRTITVDSTLPSIIVYTPNGTLNYGALGQNVSLNYSITDTNIGSCWYNYNLTNRTIPCNANSSLILTTQKNLTIYANDTAGNLNSLFVDWDYLIFNQNVSYTTPVSEGNTVYINTTITASTPPSSITLNYNGVLYSPTVTSIGTTYFINSITIAPSVVNNTNITFNYIFVVSGNTIISPSYTQLINNVNILTGVSCNATTYQLLNITNYDEDLQTPLNGTVEYVFKLLNNNLLLTTISGNLTGNSLLVCSNVNLTTSSALYSLELRYYAPSYFYETYNVENAPTSSLPISIPLYFLNQTNGIQFKINYVDFNYFQHPGAIIQMQRQYLSDNVYKIVEIPKIGDNGQAIGSFSTANIRYKLIVIDNGVILDTFDNIFPACQNIILGTCDLDIRGSEIQSSTTTGDFTYTLTKTNTSLVLTYIIPSGVPRTVTFSSQQDSRFLSDITNCNTTVFGSGGTISCDYNATIGDSIISTTITSPGLNTLYGQVHNSEDLSGYYLLNNYVIGFVLLLSLGLMFVSSGVMLVIVSVVGFMFLGVIFLLRGFDLTTITSSIMWLVIASIIVVYNISKKEERT